MVIGAALFRGCPRRQLGERQFGVRPTFLTNRLKTVTKRVAATVVGFGRGIEGADRLGKSLAIDILKFQELGLLLQNTKREIEKEMVWLL